MYSKKLKIGDVFEADKSLYSNSGYGDAKYLRQHFSARTQKPSPAIAAERLEPGRYVVTGLSTETDYQKLYCATEEERDCMMGDGSAERNFVTAIKLNPDGSFNAKGQEVIFSPDHEEYDYVRQVNVISKMRQTFVPAGR